MEMNILQIAHNVLQPFTRQQNTGNAYELYHCLYWLRKMGLTDTDLVSLEPLFQQICEKNVKSQEKIKKAIENGKKITQGSGIRVYGNKVASLRNVTQNDGDGGTADLVLILEDSREIGVSVFEGTVMKDGTIKKCLSNPTCKRFGCGEAEIQKIKEIAKDAVTEYKKEMAVSYGSDETLWPSRVTTQAAFHAQNTTAELTKLQFETLSIEQQRLIFCDLLHLTKNPANALCIVDKEVKSLQFFKIEKTAIEDFTPSLKVDGIFLDMYVNDTHVGKTQVKFNNGVYHKGNTSSLTSSWNAVAYMNHIFTLSPLVRLVLGNHSI